VMARIVRLMLLRSCSRSPSPSILDARAKDTAFHALSTSCRNKIMEQNWVD
jgi:hypothetical protein